MTACGSAAIEFVHSLCTDCEPFLNADSNFCNKLSSWPFTNVPLALSTNVAKYFLRFSSSLFKKRSLIVVYGLIFSGF